MQTYSPTTYTAPPVQAARPLRVLMVAARYYPYMGGIETHIYEVARRLAEAGVHVTIGTTDVSGKLPVEEQQHGVVIRRVPAYPAERDFYFAPAITRLIANGGWDVVHCQGYHTFVAPMAMLAARRARLPYLVTFHSGGHSSGLRHALRGAQQAALGPLLRRAEKLIAVSQFEAQLFRERLRPAPGQLVVVPNGAHVPAVEHVAEPGAGPLILSVGRLERYKGHHRVLAAMPQLLEWLPNARLRIIGGGPYEQALRQQAAQLGLTDQVEIGPIPPSDRQRMAQALGSAALVVLLSDYEAHPVSVMEALSVGRPMLVAETSGLQEIVDRGLARGLAVDSAPEVVAAAMRDLIERPPVVPQIALPTWEGCAATLHTLYRAAHAAHSETRKPV